VEEGEIEADAIVRQAGASVAEVQAALLELELAGLVRVLPGSRYVRPPEK
jgi:predicted Rossmann fold nucleotide-binding protein DprA/Smf involved in DNA uptake